MKASRFALALACVLIGLAAGCNKLASWKNQQIQSSNQSAAGSKITPPAQPITVPSDVQAALPLDPAFTILSYSDTGGTVSLTALSQKETTATCEWFLTEMARRGYGSEDNASRILEGLEFISEQAAYKRVWVKVSMNSSDQTTIEIKANK
jgi:hypothetical protein